LRSELGEFRLSTTTAIGGTGSHRFVVDSGRDMAWAFARAARHSRRVRFLRVALPVTIALILGTTWLVSWLDPLKVLVRLPTDAGRLVVSGTKITMEAPKLSGYTRDRRWYELTATAAATDITKPDLIELHDVRAKIEAEDKSSTMFLDAKDGIFNRKAGILTLNNDISLRSSGNYEMKLTEAVVDTANGEVVSNKPVEVITQQATLRAERLEVVKSGEIVRFIGNVVMNVATQDNDGARAEKK
jgi:lipopolysaccharide export system protein LptC